MVDDADRGARFTQDDNSRVLCGARAQGRRNRQIHCAVQATGLLRDSCAESFQNPVPRFVVWNSDTGKVFVTDPVGRRMLLLWKDANKTELLSVTPACRTRDSRFEFDQLEAVVAQGMGAAPGESGRFGRVRKAEEVLVN